MTHNINQTGHISRHPWSDWWVVAVKDHQQVSLGCPALSAALWHWILWVRIYTTRLSDRQRNVESIMGKTNITCCGSYKHQHTNTSHELYNLICSPDIFWNTRVSADAVCAAPRALLKYLYKTTKQTIKKRPRLARLAQGVKICYGQPS